MKLPRFGSRKPKGKLTWEETRRLEAEGRLLAHVSPNQIMLMGSLADMQMRGSYPTTMFKNAQNIGKADFRERLQTNTISEEMALSYSPVSRAIGLISSSVAGFPWVLGERTGKILEPRYHQSIHDVFNTHPNDYDNAFTFWRSIVERLIFDNEVFVYYEKNPYTKFPSTMTRLEQWRVAMRSVDRRARYDLMSNDGNVAESWDYKNIMHFRGPGNTMMDSGMSVIEQAAASIKMGLIIEEHTASLFQGGSLHNIVLYSKDPKADLNKKDMVQLAKDIQTRIQAGIHGKLPLSIPAGIEAKEISITPQDAQLIESRRLQRTITLSYFGVPNYKANEEATTNWGKNIEETSIAFEQDTLSPYQHMLESGVNYSLFHGDRMEMFLDSRDYSRDTMSEQIQSAARAVGGNEIPGIFSVNEARANLGYSKLKDPKYDEPYVPTRKENANVANQET